MGMQPTLRFSGFEGDWSVRSIRDLGFEISDGNYGELYPKSDEFVASGVPFIRANNMNGGTVSWSDMRFISPKQHAVLKSGHLRYRDILVTTRGDIGTVSLVPIEFEGANINAQICLLRNATAALQEFVFFALIREQARKQFKELQTGSALKQLPRKNLSKIAGYYPPMAEQTKIAEFLGAVDEKIRLLEARLEQLTLYKKAMMQKIFSQEIRFKQEARSAEGATGKQKSDDGGEFPDWETKKFGEVFEEIKDQVGDRDIETYSISAGVGFRSQKEKFGKNISGNQNRKYIVVRPGQFSYNKGNSKSYKYGCVYLNKLGFPIAVPNVFISFKLIDKKMNAGFFAQLFIGHFLDWGLRRIISSSARMDGLLNVPKTEFFKLEIPVPHPEEQQKIADFLSVIDEKTDAVSAQITQMQSFKKGLLQQMFV